MKKSNLQFYCAASVLLLIIGASILAPLLVTHNPFEPDMANRLQPPSWQHFLVLTLWDAICSAAFFTVAVLRSCFHWLRQFCRLVSAW